MFSIFDLDFKDSWLSSKESDEVLQDMITKKKKVFSDGFYTPMDCCCCSG